jgi:PEP-CTERM motif
MKKSILGLALLLAAAGAQAALCTFVAKDTICTFATDTTGGQAIYTNPTNLSNIGSGSIKPFLGLQANGTESGVSTDDPQVNILPLNDKRDNANTFTRTFTRNDLAVIDIGGKSFYQFLLDTNEPSSADGKMISIDTLRIWDAKSAALQLLTNANVPTLGALDGLFSSLIYSMGPFNNVLMDGTLFSGSGLGYDLSVFIPVDAFAGVAMDSRLIFGTGLGGLEGAGADATSAGGFEEWAYVQSTAAVPEPETYALMLAGFAVVAGIARRRKFQR